MTSRVKPISSDVVFINPDNNEAECTYNTCVKNFTIKGEEDRVITDYWSDGTPIPYKFFFSQCNKCNRVISTDADKNRTKKSRQTATKASYDAYQEARKSKLMENS
jgi:hypothetical protein